MRRQALSLLTLLLALPLVSTLPANAQDWAKARLEKSPRHREWVALKHDGRTVNAYVVYPESKTKTPVVVLIHEIFGASDWTHEMADEIAAQGYIVVAPDLLSGFGPNGGGSDAFKSQEDTTKAVSALDANTVLADLDSAADYAKTIPSFNGKLFVTGYCWGGGKSFAFATHRKDLTAAFVFYGPPPPDADMRTSPRPSSASTPATTPASTPPSPLPSPPCRSPAASTIPSPTRARATASCAPAKTPPPPAT
jgi:carboxymethylenebutenolidase